MSLKQAASLVTRSFGLAVLGLSMLVSGSVFAACSNPSGSAGDQVYNSTYGIMQFCNGTSWISMASAASGSGNDNLGNHTATQDLNMAGYSIISGLDGTYTGTVTAANFGGTNISGTLIQAGASTATCASGLNGAIRYNSTSNTLQICVGTTWTSLSSSTTAGSGVTGGTANYGAIFSGATTLTTDTALYVDTTSHRLGIGTNVPSTTLDVSGSVGNVQVTSDGAHIKLTRPSNNYIQASSAGGNLFFGVNGNADLSPSLFISSAGNVGINTTSPLDMLDVRPVAWSSNQNGGIRIGTPNGEWVNRIALKSDSSGVPRLAFDVSDASNGSTLEAMSFARGGKIGISTTMPSSTLTVNGEVQVSSTGVACTSSTNGGAIRYTGGALYYCNGANTWTALASGGTPAGSTGDIQFNNGGAFAADTGQLFWDGTNNRLGIGTSSPGYPLTVSADIALSQTGGTHSPQLTWLVNGTRQGYMGWGTTGSDFDIFADNGNNLALITTGSNAPIVFYPSSTERMRITPAGNVGIGTNSPGAGLEVATPVSATTPAILANLNQAANPNNRPFYAWTSAWGPVSGGIEANTPNGWGTQLYSNQVLSFNAGGFSNAGAQMTILTNGNVGIGTTSPADPLQVNGNISSGANGGANGQLVVRRNTDGNATGFISTDTSSNLNIIQNGGSGAMTFSTALTERARITNGGSVGIGTTAPGGALEVSGSNALRLSGTSTAHAPYIEWYAGGTRNAYMGWGTPGSNFNLSMENGNALNITASNTTISGAVGVNSGAPTGTAGLVLGREDSSYEGGQINFNRATDNATAWYLDVYGNTSAPALRFINVTGTGTVAAAQLDTSGNMTAVAYLYSSDKRLKSDITTLTGGLAKLDALNPVSFRFTADPSKTTHLGLIAQDVQKVYPEAVHADDKGFLKLDYPALIGPIVDMLKEMKSIVVSDHTDLAVANAEIVRLKAANDNLRTELKVANDNEAKDRALLDALAKDVDALKRGHGAR